MPGLAPFKQQALMRYLRMRLELSVAGVSYEESLDASSNPIMKLTKGAEVMFVKIEGAGSAGRIDGLGLPQTVYNPHKTTLLQELDVNAADSELRALVLSECVRTFTEVLVYQVTPMPASYDLTGAALTATIRSDVVHPLTSQQ